MISRSPLGWHMRSIRRSLLGYLLLLLAIALGAVAVFVDQYAHSAIRSRETSESERIEQTFKLRQIEVKSKFDGELLNEAKSLAREVHRSTANVLGQSWEPPRRLLGMEFTVAQIGAALAGQSTDFRPRLGSQFASPLRAPEEESRLYRLRFGLMELATPPTILPTLATIASLDVRVPSPQQLSDPRVFNDIRRYNPYPWWIEYDAPFFLQRAQEAIRKPYEDDEHPGGFQITLAAGPFGFAPKPIGAIYQYRQGGERFDLPLTGNWYESDPELEPRIEDVEVPGRGSFRTVTTSTTANGRVLVFNAWVPPPTIANTPQRLLPRGPHLTIRLVIQVAKPTSELDARLRTDQMERDAQLARVREETRGELSQLRYKLCLIGSSTFVALVLGGWFFVARGLAPLRILSDAVSRVSEKDFRLPVVSTELGRELAPIHARITQTLTLLQRAFAREKQAVADISHELRTPIASLLATIDVALRKPRTPEQYRGTLEECRLISKQLGQLVERIMTLASLDAGNDHAQTACTDASELATSCAAVIRPLVTVNNLALTTQIEEELIFDTDAAKLREVLMNLLHNAVEYNQPNSTIELVAKREGNSAVFEVRDTGIGMTAEVRERIFERFYRADASRTATGVHAGLGLSIVREYVTRLQGTIDVQSEVGVGTTFRVVIPAPVSTESDPFAEQEQTEHAPAGS